MAIGRISGPMLFANLERQGLDLAIDGNLLYFDVNRRRIGINTDSPEYDLHITGFDNTEATLFVNGNIIAARLAVANAFTLPTDSGLPGDILTSDGNRGTYWSPSLGSTLTRKKFNYQTPDLPVGTSHDFEMEIGVANIVYALTVDRPCLVEVFATPAKNELNPYTFYATLDHLVDDGTVLLNDGSVIQQRQYSIFANQEEPPVPKVYARISNVDGLPGPVNLSLLYFTGAAA